MNIEHLLKKAKTPAPPAELRQRILERVSLPEKITVTIWDRLWKSRTLRIGWSVSVVGLGLFLLTWNPAIPGFVEQKRKPMTPMNVIWEIGFNSILSKLQEGNQERNQE